MIMIAKQLSYRLCAGFIMICEVIFLPRFFAAACNIAKGVVILSGADKEHIKVLRLKIGDRITVCDGSGRDHHCLLTKIKNDTAEAEITASEPSPAEPSVKCTVLAGMSKGERSDYTVQKCTEAGAAEIIFFSSARSVSRINEKNTAGKTARWQRIAEEAAKQSGRGMIPKVSCVFEFADTLNIAVSSDLSLFLYETGERIPLKKALCDARPFSSAAVMTGPEGGFERFEADLAAAAGLILCSLGPRILRCETAPVVALSALMFHTDNL